MADGAEHEERSFSARVAGLRPAWKGLGAYLIYQAIACLIYLPPIRAAIGTRYVGDGWADARLYQWALAWTPWALLHHESPLFAPNVFVPDGANLAWSGERPEGEGTWQPTPPAYPQQPLEPMAGNWRTWLVPDVVGMRPSSPPEWGSPAWRAQVAAVREAVARRTPEQEDAVLRWAGSTGTVTPAGVWIEIARDLVTRYELDDSAAARALALTSVAIADAFVYCWDAKYAYWYARPVTADPSLFVLIPTPPFPSYTSGHSTYSAAAAEVLSYMFPSAAGEFHTQKDEAAISRLYGGIHYRSDIEIGKDHGSRVGGYTVSFARTDGADLPR